MRNLISKLIADESAQDMAEYGIALAVIGTAAGAAALVIATDVNSLWTKAQKVIDTAAGA
jgi:Flp pilus assembly pilin Flp